MKAILLQLNLGFRSYFKALQFLQKNKAWHFLLIPGLIHLVLFIASSVVAFYLSSFVVELIHPNIEEWELWGWLEWTLSFIISWGIKTAIIALYFYVYKYIILLLMSPIFSFIAEYVTGKLEGNTLPFSWTRLSKEIIRGIQIAIRNTALQLLFLVLLFIISFIPFVNLIVPFAILFADSYFFGFSMMDYYHEQKMYSKRESIAVIRKNKGIAIANGLSYYTLMLIPFIGWLIAPILSIIAGTISAHDLKTITDEQR